MVKIALLFSFISLANLIFSQNDNRLNISPHYSKKEIRDQLNEILHVEIEKESLSAGKYNFIASCYAELGITDSAYIYLEKSKAINPNWFCEFTSMNVYKTSPITKDPRYYYFTQKLDIEKLVSILKNCPPKYKVHHDSMKSRNTIWDSIFYKDQKYRKMINTQNNENESLLWNKQDSLDLICRVLIDSLYTTLPDFFNQQSEEVTWFVLQHSTNCDWTKKWLLRYLNAYQEKKVEIRFLPQTFERFYKPESGYCRKQNETESNDFIEYLLQKYPKEYAEIFGYEDYLIN